LDTLFLITDQAHHCGTMAQCGLQFAASFNKYQKNCTREQSPLEQLYANLKKIQQVVLLQTNSIETIVVRNEPNRK